MKVNIASVGKFWYLLVETLRHAPCVKNYEVSKKVMALYLRSK
jgi:hypothetical protein